MFDSSPEQIAFPFPYADTFDQYTDAKAWGYLPHFFADIAGAFELATCPDRPGQCLHQAVPVPTHSWAPDWMPYSIIGDEHWQDYKVAADIYLNNDESAAVMGRVNDVGTGYGFIPKGYALQLSGSGTLKLSVWRGKIDKKKLIGDAEQQAKILAGIDDSVGGERILATTHIDGVAPGQWHRLELQFDGSTLTGLIDGKAVLTTNDRLYDHGMAGLLAFQTPDKTSQPYFDNFAVTAVGGARAPSLIKTEPGPAIYAKTDHKSDSGIAVPRELSR
jgi:galactosylceramidase